MGASASTCTRNVQLFATRAFAGYLNSLKNRRFRKIGDLRHLRLCIWPAVITCYWSGNGDIRDYGDGNGADKLAKDLLVLLLLISGNVRLHSSIRCELSCSQG